MGVGGQRHALTAWPPGKTRYPLYRRLGRPQGRSGQAKISPPMGFDPRTVQPVVSRYTDWAARPTNDSYGNGKGKFHPTTVHEDPDGDSGVALLFL